MATGGGFTATELVSWSQGWIHGHMGGLLETEGGLTAIGVDSRQHGVDSWPHGVD
jgi:hypothetical protein